jgi:hypothetical protein
MVSCKRVMLTHETSRVGAVSADLSVDLDKTLHEDVLDFLTVQGILQTVAQEDNKRKALAGLVGTSAGLGSIGTCAKQTGLERVSFLVYIMMKALICS